MKPLIFQVWKKGVKMNYQPPKRRFERAGYVNPETAYYVPIENITNEDNEDMKTMVDHGRYFSIFAPRQSGKTTFFKSFANEMETNSNYIFILMSFENCKRDDSNTFYSYIQKMLYNQLLQRLERLNCHELKTVKNFIDTHGLVKCADFYSLFEELNRIITRKKIVIFIDEFDGIPPEEIETFLSTLRKLYQDYKSKKEKALYSVGLVGIRNITQLVVGGVSPFNIADHVEIPSFTLKNVRDLYLQYTQETNQPFTEEAVQKVFEQTQGQPWLVNRLGGILTKQIKPKTTDQITEENVEQAIDILLEENNNHFNNLTEKILLYHKTFKQILNGTVKYNVLDCGQSFLRQYGITKICNKEVVIANPIYRKLFLQANYSIEPEKKKIFISYCHEDKDWLTIIMKYLKGLEYEDIEIWFDKKIKTGDEWNPVIDDAIQTSHMTICLISQQYLYLDFIRTREVPQILNKQKEGMIVFPVLFENCTWKVISWIKSLQIFPGDGIPLEDLTEKEQKTMFIKLIDQIHEAFNLSGMEERS
jgi:hypothetical protein